MTAYRANLFLTGIHLLMVTGTEWSAFPGADHCQSQIQTPHSRVCSTYWLKNVLNEIITLLLC
jgi:hypothetical protein